MANNLPYDCEIEYLESAGTQYVDTLTPMDGNLRVVLDYVCLNTLVRPFGAADVRGTVKNQWYLVNDRNQAVSNCSLGSTTNANINIGQSPVGVRTTATIDGRNLSAYGGTATMPSWTLTPKTDDCTLGIFACHVVRTDGSNPWVLHASMRLYSCAIYDGTTLVRSFVPVKKNGVGYLYDKVSGQLFGNAGTGSFVCGPVVGLYNIPANATRIRYLESTGTQYIDTGVAPDATTAVDLRGRFPAASGKTRFGSRVSNGTAQMCVIAISTNKIRIDVGTGESVGSGKASQWEYTTEVCSSVVIDARTNSASVTTSGGTVISHAYSSSATFSGALSMLAFAFNNGGTIVGATEMRVSALQITQSGVLVRSYVPVRVGQVGYLFDRVSGQLFGNAGTGSFVCGPVVGLYNIPANATRIRYLESTGTQYIDTGVVPTLSDAVSVDADMVLTTIKTNDNNILFGSYYDNNVAGTSTVFQSRLFAFVDSSRKARIAYGGAASGTVAVSAGDRLAVSAQFAAGNSRLLINGVQSSASSSSPTVLPNIAIWIFRAAYGIPTVTVSPCSARIYSLTITVNGTLVRAFVPVRVGTVGYLFDRVSGELFSNAGTGNFVLGPDTFSQGVVPTRMMAMGVRKKPKPYPWDYRVEYFEVATTQPFFECGPLSLYNGNWPDPIGDESSDLQTGIRNNSKGWFVFSYPKALSTHQRFMGNYSTFYVRGRVSKYEMGGFNGWFSNPSSWATNANSINTKTVAFYESLGSDTVRLGIIQGQTKNTTTESVSGKRMNYTRYFPILKTAEGGSYVNGDIYAGTRFYESGFDFNIPGNLELHLRFVPCVKDNKQYICEMNSGTMISASGTGALTSGPQVADDYKAWDGQT